MRLREKGKAEAEPVFMGWDEAQAALAAGTHEVAEGAEAEDGCSNDEAGEEADQGKGGEPPGDNYDTLTRPELEKLAQDRGLDIGSARTKADIVEALRRAP